MEPAGNRAFAAPPPLVAAATLELDSPAAERVGWGFIALYTLAFMSTSLLFLAPVLVTLALKVNSLVGIPAIPRRIRWPLRRPAAAGISSASGGRGSGFPVAGRRRRSVPAP